LAIFFVEQFQFEKAYGDLLPSELVSVDGILRISDVTGENKICVISYWPLEEKVCRQIKVFSGRHSEICLEVPSDIMGGIGIHFGFVLEENRFVDVTAGKHENKTEKKSSSCCEMWK
jgi:hypothetical protein